MGLHMEEESLDAMNIFGQWCPAQRLQLTSSSVLVHFLNMNSSWDAWYPIHSSCLAPSSSKASNDAPPLTHLQTIDVKFQSQWIEAIVLQIRADELFIRTRDTEFWIPFLPSFVAPHGANSPVPNAEIINTVPRMRTIDNSSFSKYQQALGEKNLSLISIQGDGNCMFRAISHQIYGDEKYHSIVRNSCIDYMLEEKTYFEPYVVGDMPAFLRYIAHKRCDGVWGDDPELQALCELYDRPLYVYVYDQELGAKCLRTFHEASKDHAPPMRVSFYGGGHYDSIVGVENNFITTRPGEYEERRLAQVHNYSIEENDTLERSRMEFQGKLSLDAAFEESIALYEEQVAKSVEANEIAAVQAESERDAIQIY
ncbi:hypothetical protein THRCLA_12229 [Thraustotheca clavata]|uniref:ubiquitinyl hydrolase 1 n=1 Tax=Thraustotheca clavata TaxID=74557 RepID=A0A1V9Z711_9STRA|nr:hypothetical protein THRCLA_12229 [Thraustotheca clavata]